MAVEDPVAVMDIAADNYDAPLSDPGTSDSSEDDDNSGEDEVMEPDDCADLKSGAAARNSGSYLQRPPTTDELISLRETQNLFHSNLFQLQTTEMLNEITPSQKRLARLTSWVDELCVWCKSLPTRKPRPVDKLPWLVKSGLRVPFPDTLPAEKSLQFGFQPPLSVTVAGSFALHTFCKDAVVDLLVEMPPACLQSTDVINARYLRKRALYATFMAWQLQTCPLVSDVRFSTINNDPLRPVVMVTGRVTSSASVKPVARLLIVPPSDAFKPSRLGPRRSNVQSHWLAGDGEKVSEADRHALPPSQELPTPRYNSRLLADQLAGQLQQLRADRQLKLLVAPAQQTLRLLSVWLRQRRLDDGPVGGMLMSMFILYLLQKRRISRLMSGYQMLRNVWAQLAGTDWSADGITFVDQPSGDQPSRHDFHECYDVVFVDPSGYHNLAADLSLSTYQRLRDEAGRALQYLDSPDVDSFQVLFMTPVPFAEAFDHVVHVHVDVSGLAATRDDPAGPPVSRRAARILATLRRGLADRVTLLDCTPTGAPSITWPCAELPPGGDGRLLLGLRLNPLRLASCVDRGPAPTQLSDDDVQKSGPWTSPAEFSRFWGDKAQTRRFQDGQIQLAVVWPAETLADKRLIVRQIVLHLLQLHHQMSPSSVHYAIAGLETVLSGTRLLPAGAASYGTGEECEQRFLAAQQRLSSVLRGLSQLPLAVAAVQGVSPAHRHAAPFPPLPDSHHALSGRSVRHANSQILERQTELTVPWCQANDVIVQLELSGKWPDDPAAVRHVKTAFHLQMCEELRASGLTASCRRTAAVVICDGYVFCVRVAYPREPALLRMRKPPPTPAAAPAQKRARTDAEPVSVEATAGRLERDTVQLPRLTSALAGMQNQYPAYSAACRLAVRWISAQMLSGLFPDIVAELLMAEVFVSAAPYVAPQQPCAALLRWLRRLAGWDWQTRAVIIDLNGDLASSAGSVADLQSKFTSTPRHTLPALVIYTPYDDSGISWTREAPARPVMVHAQKLALASAEHLSACVVTPGEHDWRTAFRPPLESFDALVRLDRRQCVRRHQAVDPKGPVVRLDSYQRQQYEALPPTGLDPVTWLVEDLRATYGHAALFWYDAHGGDVIGVILRPGALTPRPLSAFRADGCTPESMQAAGDQEQMLVATSVPAMIEYIRIAGDGIVDSVHVEGDRLSALAVT